MTVQGGAWQCSCRGRERKGWCGGTSVREDLQLAFFRPGAHLVVAMLLFASWILLGHWLSRDVWRRGTWGKLRNATEYCEEGRHDQFMVEPVNSLSNFTFVAYGMIVLSLAWSDLRDAVGVWRECGLVGSFVQRPGRRAANIFRFPFWSFLVSAGLMWMGTSSFLFHASYSTLGQTMDVSSIYVGMSVLIIYESVRFLPLQLGAKAHLAANMAGLALAIATGPLFFYCKGLYNARTLFFVMTATVILLLLVHRVLFARSIRWRLVSAAVISLAGAGLARTADVNRWWCNPSSFLQGHALWHFLCATAFFLAYLTMRTEKCARGLLDTPRGGAAVVPASKL